MSYYALVIISILFLVLGWAVAYVCGFKTEYSLIRKNKGIKMFYKAMLVVYLFIVDALFVILIDQFDFSDGAVLASNKASADIIATSGAALFATIVVCLITYIFFKKGSLERYHLKKNAVLYHLSDSEDRSSNDAKSGSKSFKKASSQ